MPRDDAKGDDPKTNYVFILQIFTDSATDTGKKIPDNGCSDWTGENLSSWFQVG